MNAGSTDEYKSILEEYKKRNTPVDLNDPAFSGHAIMNASNEGNQTGDQRNPGKRFRYRYRLVDGSICFPYAAGSTEYL